VFSAFPEKSIAEKAKDVSECIDMLHSYGITTVSDITLPEDIDVYLELSKQKKLNIRINSYLPFSEFENLKFFEEKAKDLDPDYFTIKGFKAFWDGALGSETALYSLNYKGKGHNGFKTKQAETGEIARIAKQIDAAGKQIIIHAIGDKAVSEVLDLFESLPNTKALRHRIEHAQHIQPGEYDRFGRIGAIASVQPVHLKYDAKTVFEKLPAKLINHTQNYVHIVKYGGVLNFGTDFPIVSAEPFENIRLAATRITNYGEFTFEHRIPMHECIKAYTYNNAYSNHNENAAGSINKGKAADFIVLKDDIFLSDDENFVETGAAETYMNGEKIYG
ncbi:MAG: amidohydrolase family protein, partial [Ignavibacteria bacterium]|nr:amidohydrolase family protein [Ignavibacteria bacterium]